MYVYWNLAARILDVIQSVFPSIEKDARSPWEIPSSLQTCALRQHCCPYCYTNLSLLEDRSSTRQSYPPLFYSTITQTRHRQKWKFLTTIPLALRDESAVVDASVTGAKPPLFELLLLHCLVSHMSWESTALLCHEFFKLTLCYWGKNDEIQHPWSAYGQIRFASPHLVSLRPTILADVPHPSISTLHPSLLHLPLRPHKAAE